MAISKIKVGDTEHEIQAKFDSLGRDIATTYVKLDGDSEIQGNIKIGSDEAFIEIDPVYGDGLRIKNTCICFDDGDGSGTYIWGESLSETEPVLTFYGYNADEPTTLRNIAIPQQEYDAANKKYVDDAVANAGGGSGSGGSGATLDKATCFNFASGSNQDVYIQNNGVEYSNSETEIELNDDNYLYSTSRNRIPIVAGDNVTFTVDEDNQVVKISTGSPIDKISSVDNWAGEKKNIDYTDVDGISWDDKVAFLISNNKMVVTDVHHRIPLAEGNNITFEYDQENEVIKINASASSGASQLQVPITYSELKSLRDNSQLIPGTFYRITDYQCTTVQENTRAMDNKFDIIVQALSANTLSENASADYHGSADSNAFKLDSFTVHYTIFEDFVDKNETIDELYPGSGEDKLIAYSYEANDDGDVVPVIYKTNMVEYENEPDYQDAYYYVGTETYDGVLYDKWRMINEDCMEDGPYWDASTGYKYILTDRIVENNEIIDSVKEQSELVKHANIPAWEIKYCLDNDNTRFAWAGGERIFYTIQTPPNSDEEVKLYRNSDFDNTSGSETSIYAWVSKDETIIAYTNDDLDSLKDITPINWFEDGKLVMYHQIGEWFDEIRDIGKGVIYYMKDEHGNECPYDFKNIQFKRMISLEHGYPELDEENGEETWVYTFCGNSYHIDNDEWSELKDGSLESPYGHMSDENTSTFHHNIIKPYFIIMDSEEEIPTKCGKAYLNNNVLFGYWEEVGSTNDEFPYYYGWCCYGNTFNNDCFNNTLSIKCSSNTFANMCHNNIFGKQCTYNSFGDLCGYNTLGSGCHNNTFGNDCEANTFGNDCVENIVEHICSRNKIQSNGIRLIRICQGVMNKTITPVRNASYPQIYESAGTTHIILD